MKNTTMMTTIAEDARALAARIQTELSPTPSLYVLIRGLERLADGLDPHRGAKVPGGPCMSDGLPTPE